MAYAAGDLAIIAEGLGFPEGPVAMEDGSVILVEIARQAVSRVWGDGRRETIATPGGGPNGAAIGPDGALYVCNNGGMKFHSRDGLLVPGHAPEDYSGGRIERIDLATGKVERLYDRCGDERLRGPNDIVFDRHGGFYFTDLGKSYRRHRDVGALFYAQADGSAIVEVVPAILSANGVGLSPDGNTVHVADTIAARLWSFALAAPGQVAPASSAFAGRMVYNAPGLRMFDSLAVTDAGAVCVATLLEGAITRVAPDGGADIVPMPDPYTTNICFGGADMRDAFITLSGTGRLARTRWPEPGLRLNFNG